MESMLDEERRDVLALLEGSSNGRTRGSASSAGSGRDQSPFTPRSPVRSMLDIAEDAPPRHASSARTNAGITKPVTKPAANPPRMGKIRSMLDLDGPAYPPPPPTGTMSAQASPTQTNHKAYSTNSMPHRSLSDAASRPAEFGPRSNVLETKTNPSSAYQFAGILTANPGGPLVPKRNTQAGKKTSLPSAMSEVVRGGDLSVFGGSRERGRNHSIASTGISTAKSKSPHNRLGLRSNSPHTSSLSPDPNKFVLNDGRVIDMNSAYRRLSDANLALSGGGLSTLGSRGRKGSSREGSDPDGGRLEKDYVPVDGEDTVESSDDEVRSSDDEGARGRKGQGGGRDSEKEEQPRTESQTTLGMGRAKGPRAAAQSLMAAAEEERM